LEIELGVKLFSRERQRLVITEAGRQYHAILRDAFDRIAFGTERLLQRQSSGALTVSTSPDFAAKWLVNRLGRFAEEHPSIDLHVSATLHHVDFARGDVDRRCRRWVGIALARTTLAATDLITGRLLRPFAEELRLSKTYWIICPQATAKLPKIVTFREWLLAEAASDVCELEKLWVRESRPKS